MIATNFVRDHFNENFQLIAHVRYSRKTQSTPVDS